MACVSMRILLACLSCATLSSGAPSSLEDEWAEISHHQGPKIMFQETAEANCRGGDVGGGASSDLTYVLQTDGTCRSSAGNRPSIAGIIYKATCLDDLSSGTLTYLTAGTPITNNAQCDGTYTPQTNKIGNCFLPLPQGTGVDGATITCLADGSATLQVWLTPTPAGPSFNETNSTIPMSDGAPLYVDQVYSPALPFPDTGSTKAAAIFISTPYNIASTFGQGLKYLVGTIEGIVFPLTGLHFNAILVLQQARGLYLSGPPTTEYAFETGTHGKSDAGDTAKWIASQDWSNKVIMTQGISAMGMFALMAADPAYPVPTRAAWYSITTNNIREAFYRQGALITGIMGSILAPDYLPPDQTDRSQLSKHDSDGPDPFWDNMLFDKFETVNYPTLVRTSWFDMFLKGGLRTGKSLSEKARCTMSKWFGCTTTLIVDALGHAGLGGIPDFDEYAYKGFTYPVNQTAQNALTAYEQILSAILLFVFQKATNDVLMDGLIVFYDALMHLIPNNLVYVYGKDYITSFSNWPVPKRWDMYFSSNGVLASKSPASSNQSYVYDPSDPAPTYGGNLFNSAPTFGSVDQSLLSDRADVIQFDSAPVPQDLALCGETTATITVTSSAIDTDFVVRLVDQHPNNGPRYLIQEGVIRMRWRDQLVTPTMMEPGKPYEVEIDMWSACWIIKAGHSVGVDITSSSAFMYLVNPNTGGSLQAGGIWPQGGEYYTGPNVTATNSIIFGPSKVTLPVVNEADLPVMAPLIIPSSLSPPSSSELIEMGKRR